MVLLFAVVDADDDDGVGDQPTVVALFVEYLQSTVNHVDVPAAVRQRFQHGLAVHCLGLGHADGHFHPHIFPPCARLKCAGPVAGLPGNRDELDLGIRSTWATKACARSRLKERGIVTLQRPDGFC